MDEIDLMDGIDDMDSLWMKNTFVYRLSIFVHWSISLPFFILSSSLSAAPYKYDVETIKHTVDNHDTEIRMLQERCNNQEATVSSLRQQVLDSSQSTKELVRGNATGFEGKIAYLESANKNLIADLQQLKSHANDSTTALNQYKSKIVELEQTVSAQNKNIENLQAALKSLTELLQMKEGATANGDNVYRVKPGDSLEKIARAHNTTIKALKERNNLTQDRINVGQKLHIP